MAELRPNQIRGPAKKLTSEVVRSNPLLGKLARLRMRQLKAAREAKKAGELDLD